MYIHEKSGRPSKNCFPSLSFQFIVNIVYYNTNTRGQKGMAMKFKYYTDRLTLKLLKPDLLAAKRALDFYDKNRIVFEQYEAMRPVDFYTERFQKNMISEEFNLALQQKAFRFWVCEKDRPQAFIGTVCFYNIIHSIYDRCEVGYKFDYRYWHHGYARETMAFAIPLLFEELNLHRMEAYVMPENAASIRLLKDSGFQCEGVCRQAIRIQDKWEDHLLFSRIK